MQANLVGAELTGDGRVNGNVAFKAREVANVVNALLEPTHKARRQADPAHTAPLEFIDDKDVLGMGSWRFGFIHRDFQFPGTTARRIFKMAVHGGDVAYRAPILDRRLFERVFVESDFGAFHVEGLADVAVGQTSWRIFKGFPGKLLVKAVQVGAAGRVGAVFDVLARI